MELYSQHLFCQITLVFTESPPVSVDLKNRATGDFGATRCYRACSLSIVFRSLAEVSHDHPIIVPNQRSNVRVAKRQ
jgi:hypothetical protein